MIASPNAGYFVYDDDRALQDLLTKWYAKRDRAAETSPEVDGRSDHAPFDEAGVPVGGAFSGAGEKKTARQAKKWGGTAGRSFDPCCHSACDDRSDVDSAVSRKALGTNTDAIAYAVWKLACQGRR